jgi:hypothetical protein
MHFWSGEKYALLVRRKICTSGPVKNMQFWSGEKYALLVRRKICSTGPVKICTFGPAKNMQYWSSEKYAVLAAPKRGQKTRRLESWGEFIFLILCTSPLLVKRRAGRDGKVAAITVQPRRGLACSDCSSRRKLCAGCARAFAASMVQRGRWRRHHLPVACIWRAY